MPSNINDLMLDGLVKADHSRLDAIADGFSADPEMIVETIRALNPSAPVLLQTINDPRTGCVG